MNGLHKTKKSLTANDKLSITLEDLLSQLEAQKYEEQCNTIKDLLNNIGYKQHKDMTIPQTIRLGVYYIAFKLSKDKAVKTISKKPYIQSSVLKDCGLSHNMFSKWKMHPRRDYVNFSQDIFGLKLSRAGIKIGSLAKMIRCLIASQGCTVFADVFGGTGNVTASVSSLFDVAILNEYDDYLHCMHEQIKDNVDEVINICRNFDNDIRNIYDYLPDETDDSDFYKRTLDTLEYDLNKKIFNAEYYSNYYKDVLQPIIIFYMMLYYQFRPYKKYINTPDMQEAQAALDTLLNNKREAVAASLYFIMSFNTNSATKDFCVSGVNINSYIDFLKKIGVTNSNEMKQHFEDLNVETPFPSASFSGNISSTELYQFSKRLKNVHLYSEDYNDFYKDIKLIYSDKDILWYFDPPYFLTSQYDAAFSDEQHVRLINILKEISDSGGKWAFSCKDTVTNKASKIDSYRYGKDGKGAIINSFVEYFEAFQADKVFEKDESTNRYCIKNISKINKHTKNHELFVYKRTKDHYNEIVITNFDCNMDIVQIFRKIWSDNDSSPIPPAFNKIPFSQFLSDLKSNPLIINSKIS